MAAKPIARRLLRATMAAVGKHGSISAAADALGLSRSTFDARFRAALAAGLKDPRPARPPAAPPAPPSAEERREILRLRAEIAQLRKDRSAADGEAMLAQAIAEARGGLAAHAIPVPGWALRSERQGDRPGVPVLHLADWHIGETVRDAEVYHMNRFDAATADERVRLTVERAISLAAQHAPAGGHQGGVVFLIGDFVSGWLHEELVRTDWCSPLQAAAWCVSRIVWALRKLRDAWARLYVLGVPGNHGRMTKRPPGKGHAFQSFDWLIYTLVAQQLADCALDRQTIILSVPDDGEQIVPVAGHRYLVMHGHQLGVKGGDGIIGAMGPIMRGATKVGRSLRGVGRDFDTLVLGHYHQTLWLPGVIVGPTLKGYDEYARVSRFGYEPAAQYLWFTHAKWGPNSPLRVFLQDPPARSDADVLPAAA